MKRIRIIKYLSIVALFVGCTDQRDLYVVPDAAIKVKTDWSLVFPTPEPAPEIWTAMFYDRESDEVRSFVFNSKEEYINLYNAKYKSILINGTLSNGLDYVRFKNTDKYETFEAYATINSRKDNGEIIVNEPEMVGAITEFKTINVGENFDIKYINGLALQVPKRGLVDSIIYTPRPLVHVIRVRVEIDSIENIKNNANSSCEIIGLSGGVMVAQRMPTHAPVTNLITFNNSKDRKSERGELIKTFSTFGPPLDLTRTYVAKLYITHKNGGIYKEEFDITDQVEVIANKIREWIASNSNAKLDLEILLRLTLPSYVVPGGAGPGLNDWEDGGKVDIPM